MKNIHLLQKALIGVFILFTNNSFSQDDCGCSAALRYDYLKSENNYFNQLLFARDLNQENFKEIQNKGGGDISLLGIKIGANGENIEKIKQTYQEQLKLQNTTEQLARYESYTTSSTSFTVFGECMKLCLESKRKGLKAYKLEENKTEVSIDLYYLGEGEASPLDVKYYVTPSNNPKENKIRIPNNTFKNVRIKRESNEAFTVIFTYSNDKSEVVHIDPYKPITAFIPIEFKKIDTIPGANRSYSIQTENNDNVGCGLVRELYAKISDSKMNVEFLRTLNDGATLFPDCVNDRKYSASRIIFKASSSDGFLFKNPVISCSGPVCGIFEEDKRFMINEPSLIIYVQKNFSLPVTLGFTAETYKLNPYMTKSASFSTNNLISFIIPNTSIPSAILHGDGFNLAPGQSGGNLVFTNQTTREDYTIFNYQLTSDTLKTNQQ